jgi:ribose-phosphate pyrophosphokinase
MDLILKNRFNFSGGEVQVVTEEVDSEKVDSEVAVIVAHLRSSDDIMALLLATDALRRQEVPRIRLVMPYVPYARQDRVMNKGEALGIKVFCDLINAQNYERVEIWDPHSDVASALLNKVAVVEQHSLVSRNLCFNEDTVLVCPDAGARKKILKVVEQTMCKNLLYADKKRDVRTGAITGTVISSSPDKWDKAAEHFIVDDIADGGRTFIELAKTLREAGVTGKIELYVTHAILSKGVEVLNGHINSVWTPNCWLTSKQIKESNKINQTQIYLL